MHNIHYMRNIHYLQEGCLLEEVDSSYDMNNIHYMQYLQAILCNTNVPKIDPALVCATTPSPYRFFALDFCPDRNIVFPENRLDLIYLFSMWNGFTSASQFARERRTLEERKHATLMVPYQ